MTKKDVPKKTRKTARKTAPLKLAAPDTTAVANKPNGRKGANGDHRPAAKSAGMARKKAGTRRTSANTLPQPPEPVEMLEKGDMVVVRMRSDWELEGEFRAIDEECVRVFDFTVCDVLRLRRRDIERIEKLVEAD